MSFQKAFARGAHAEKSLRHENGKFQPFLTSFARKILESEKLVVFIELLQLKKKKHLSKKTLT